ncbi:MAG: aminotransferase class I/II-fold pyridoxal phosphate-dependent enzyme, partial [Candidatus Aminicenantes bacterium]|nr:aminotransferase class I/II-fold pyridoxal phosphate-dependent enzyme [Candidatus Aminicenantes bacterium]
TGTVYSREELEELVFLAKKYDLYLIGDEVYKEFVYDGLAHVSLLEFDEIKDRVIVADSISKRFSCCGARVGAVITRNEEVFQALLRFAQARLCPPTVEQRAALAAYRLGRSYFEPIRQEYQKRRDILYEGLKEIPGVILHKPQGAFYINVKLPIDDGENFVRWLLTDFRVDGETVMVAPGSGFYATPGKGKDEVRMAYVLKEEHLRRAIQLFKIALENYPGRVKGKN